MAQDTHYDKPYTTVREADFYDRLFWTYYRLGMQSNLVLAAEYKNPYHALNRAIVDAALRLVVKAQPRLRQVFVPDRREKDQTRLNVGLLNEIDIGKCIEFVDKDDGKGVTDAFVEKLHNEWFDWAEDEPSIPSWKLIIKGQHVLFVYSHATGDGMSGYVFHREFLAALNRLTLPAEKPQLPPLEAIPEDANAGAVKLAPLHVMGKPSILTIIWRALFYFVLGMVYGGRRLNDDYPASKPYHADLIEHPSPENRVQSLVSSRRIPAPEATRILEACRSNRVTLTPLLSALYVATMALDHFPKAVMSTPSIAYDLRPLLPMDKFQQGSSPRGAGVIMNAASGAQWPLWLAPLRKLFLNGQVDQPAFWSYIRRYKDTLTKLMHGESTKVFLAPQLLGDKLEDLLHSVFPRMDTHHVNLISNIGAFHPLDDIDKKSEPEGWQITDVQFSVPNTNGTIGPHGVILSVAGVKGGDVNIFTSYEKGVVRREQAEEILDGIVQRVYQVTGIGQPGL